MPWGDNYEEVIASLSRIADAEVPLAIAPEDIMERSTGDATPLYYRASDYEDERETLIETVKVRLSRGERIAILLPQRRQVNSYAKRCREAGLPTETPKQVDFNTDVPKIMPYHSAKGLTFDTVFMPGLTSESFAKFSNARIRRLLFVGITRATGWVYMSNTQDTQFALLDGLEALVKQGRMTARTSEDASETDNSPTVFPQSDDPLDGFL